MIDEDRRDGLLRAIDDSGQFTASEISELKKLATASKALRWIIVVVAAGLGAFAAALEIWKNLHAK